MWDWPSLKGTLAPRAWLRTRPKPAWSKVLDPAFLSATVGRGRQCWRGSAAKASCHLEHRKASGNLLMKTLL